MAKLDDTEEFLRLQALYARLTEDELQAVADEAYELTNLAKQALQAEILRRKLRIQLGDAPPPRDLPEETRDFNPSDLDLVVARRVWDLSEASQAKGALDDARVPSYLGPENLESVDNFKSSFENGVDLKVRSVDNQVALQVLSRSMPPETEADDNYVPVCPKCHSDEIVFRNLDPSQSQESAFDATFNWSCDACGHQWKDDGIEAQA